MLPATPFKGFFELTQLPPRALYLAFCAPAGTTEIKGTSEVWHARGLKREGVPGMVSDNHLKQKSKQSMEGSILAPDDAVGLHLPSMSRKLLDLFDDTKAYY